MPEWFEIAEKQWFGQGKEASVLGPPWDVYRVNDASYGNLLDEENRAVRGVPCTYEIATPEIKKAYEGEKIPGVILYEVSTDPLLYQLRAGDVFILADPVNQIGFNKVTFETGDINGFILSQLTTNKIMIGVRVNKTCSIYRVNSESESGEWGRTKKTASPVVLSSGSYSVGTRDASPSVIPIGMFPVARPYGDKAFSDVPGMPKKSGWSGFLPPMSGFKPREDDRIILADGSKYTVIFAAIQETGALGTYVFLEREAAQN